eukprot:COSAG02_NODE_17926_length_973_cov_1.024083_2_plen_118_part_00
MTRSATVAAQGMETGRSDSLNATLPCIVDRLRPGSWTGARLTHGRNSELGRELSKRWHERKNLTQSEGEGLRSVVCLKHNTCKSIAPAPLAHKGETRIAVNLWVLLYYYLKVDLASY